MIVLGLTGSSGSGKGYISDLFAKHGYSCLDTDAVCHELYGSGTECTAEMAEKIGSEILSQDGSVDRKKLGSLAFSSDEVYRLMNEIAHKHVRIRTLEWIEEMKKSGVSVAVIDAPLLFEAGFDRICDINVAVTCDNATKVRRLRRRDGISDDAIASRLGKQKPDPWYVMQADYVIDNSASSEDSLSERVGVFCEMLDEISHLSVKIRPRSGRRR